ncbi:MAG TPA: 4Fe-4S dicluster domain-containing protein [Paludibacter sp.]|nr:4Fe-4S dicluster domain-containing protein [Paludibacter sp.]
MKRTIIKIDEELCNGCEACVQGCHEGALQMIDGKARMVSELFCDGLGACIGDCPVGAITLEEREAEPYDEIATIERMIPKGEKTIIAHLKHLKEHGEVDYLKQGVGYLRANGINIDFAQVHNHNGAGCASKPVTQVAPQQGNGGGCPGSREMSFAPAATPGFKMATAVTAAPASQLRQWPVQLHLLNPEAGYFRGADVVLAADCVAFSFADFHNRFLAGKILAIACPKLDSNQDIYVEKLKNMIANSSINTLTVVIMEVPCCGGLLRLAQKAVAEAGRKIPVKLVVIGTRGDILKEEWV